MSEHRIHDVPIQSLIDHIKTAVDVDDWAKEMVEDFLKMKPEAHWINHVYKCDDKKYECSHCRRTASQSTKYCPFCGSYLNAEEPLYD